MAGTRDEALRAVRIAYLENEDLTRALESLCDIAVSEQSNTGSTLIEADVEKVILPLIFELAVQIGLHKPRYGYGREQGHGLSQNRAAGFRSRLRRKLNKVKAQILRATLQTPTSPTSLTPAGTIVEVNWLETELKLRGWSTGDLHSHGGPDHHTTDGYLKGEKIISRESLKKIVDALNKKLDGRREIELAPLPYCLDYPKAAAFKAAAKKKREAARTKKK